AGRFFEAGQAYADINVKVPAADQKQAVYTTVVSFWNALKEPKKLTRLELVSARAGLRDAAREYISRYPKGEQIAKVKFNLARTYYDEGEFEEAVELLAAYVIEFPQSDETSIALHLALDCRRARDDFEGLVALGKRFLADPRLGEGLRTEVAEIVKGAESRELDQATLRASGSGDRAAEDGLLKYAASHTGTELGEKALLNAFVTAKNSDDFDKVFAIGERFLKEYPKSQALPDVLATLGKMAAQAVEFRRSARYLEEAARSRPADPKSVEMLRASAAIRAHLGDVSGAKEAYRLVLQRASTPDRRRDASLELAELLERVGQYEEAAQALTSALAEGAGGASTYYRLGYARHRLGAPEEAIKYFKLSADRARGAETAEDLDGAAGSNFYLGQILLEEFGGIAFGQDRSIDRQILMAKKMRFDGAQSSYLAAVRLGRPQWAIASLARLAVLYEGWASFIENAPAPEGQDAGAYKAALKKEAGPWHKKAQDALSTCTDLVHKQAIVAPILSPAAQACLSGKPLNEDPAARPPAPARRGGAAPDQAAVFRKRIAKNSKDFESLEKLALLTLQGGDIYEAQLILDKAVEGGAPAPVWNLRGVVHFMLGERQAAYEDFRRALDKDAHYSYTLANLAFLFHQYGYAQLARSHAARVNSTKLEAGAVALLPNAREALAALGVK
ncbi:MAG TPA: tetratricopeptide repeat protein, partial [Polyangia bacterium]